MWFVFPHVKRSLVAEGRTRLLRSIVLAPRCVVLLLGCVVFDIDSARHFDPRTTVTNVIDVDVYFFFFFLNTLIQSGF